MTLTVIDDSLGTTSNQSLAGLSVVIFKSDPSLFPDVQSVGEVVQFRHMRIQNFQSALQAVSTNWTAYTVFSRDARGEWQSRPPAAALESSVAEILDRISTASLLPHGVALQSPKKSSSSRRLLTIDQLESDLYFDLVAQVVKVLPSTRPSQLTIVLSDFTANPLIKTDPAHFDLPPQYAHRLLLTTFWDNFSDHAAQLREGQFVKINNLRAKKISAPSDGDLSSGGLVAILHGDRSNTEKIFHLPPTSGEVAILNCRYQEFLEDTADSQTFPEASPPTTLLMSYKMSAGCVLPLTSTT